MISGACGDARHPVKTASSCGIRSNDRRSVPCSRRPVDADPRILLRRDEPGLVAQAVFGHGLDVEAVLPDVLGLPHCAASASSGSFLLMPKMTLYLVDMTGYLSGSGSTRDLLQLPFRMLRDGVLHERRIEDRHVDAAGEQVLHDAVRGVIELDLADAVDALQLGHQGEAGDGADLARPSCRRSCGSWYPPSAPAACRNNRSARSGS